MEAILQIPANLLNGGDSTVMLGLLVFLAAGTLAFSVMVALRVRGSVKRRTARILDESARNANSRRSLRYSSRRMAQRLLDYSTKHYSNGNQDAMKVLRQRLLQAGIYDPRGVALFFVVRTGLAIGMAAAVFLFLPMFWSAANSGFWMAVIVAGVAGYVGPSVYIDKRIKARRLEHRAGFPDLMDLLVVCADAGLPLEAAFERIGREFGDSYPSMTSNIHMTNLEIRAGRPLTDALEHFADRVGLEEVRSFVTLISQSLELGSSITDALRVYSDDMRHKRLSRAEEKAYALPAKLALPMMVCIFPTLFVVILLPVFVRIYTHNF
jgi:tight adherence protein C